MGTNFEIMLVLATTETNICLCEKMERKSPVRTSVGGEMARVDAD